MLASPNPPLFNPLTRSSEASLEQKNTLKKVTPHSGWVAPPLVIMEYCSLIRLISCGIDMWHVGDIASISRWTTGKVKSKYLDCPLVADFITAHKPHALRVSGWQSCRERWAFHRLRWLLQADYFTQSIVPLQHWQLAAAITEKHHFGLMFGQLRRLKQDHTFYWDYPLIKQHILFHVSLTHTLN